MDRGGEGRCCSLPPFLNALLISDQQYTLLTEILKKAGIPSSYLVRMINEFRISPSWGDIPLPQGT